MIGLMGAEELAAARADIARSFPDEVIRTRYIYQDDDLGQSEGIGAVQVSIVGRLNKLGKDPTGRLAGIGADTDREFTAAWGADIKTGDVLSINGSEYRVSTCIDNGANSLISQYKITMIKEAE